MIGGNDNTTRVGHLTSSSHRRLSLVLRFLGHNPSTSHPTFSVGRSPSPTVSPSGRPRVVCFYCNTPGHVKANCRKRIAKMSGNPSDEAPVQLLSTVSPTPDILTDGKTSVKQKGPVLDPRFEQHCTPAQLVRPDSSVLHVRLLRYTCLLYTSPSPRDGLLSRMPSSA